MADEEIEIGDEGMFAKAKDFDELYKILRNEKEIIGSDGEDYKAEYLVLTIAQFRKKLKIAQQKAEIKEISEQVIKELIKNNPELMEKIYCITREEGLRLKVVELAIKEAIARGGK